jgi:hypothetical protein
MAEETLISATTLFKTQTGHTVPVCSLSQWQAALSDLTRLDAIQHIQIIEGCGFSFAMVVRFALGLSADGGVVTLFVTDTFYGWIALACARHLLNAGGTVRIVLVGTECLSSFESGCLLPALEQRGASVRPWVGDSLESEIRELIDGSHNVLFGAADAAPPQSPWLKQLGHYLNDSAVPVHTVGAPLGVTLSHPLGVDALYASSTLSLGLPLVPVTDNTDLLGRHYLADVSFSLDTYRKLGYAGPPLFAEQPVIRLLSGN